MMREGPRVESPRALRRCQENWFFGGGSREPQSPTAGHTPRGAGSTTRSRLDDDGPREVRIASRRMVHAVIRERARLRERVRDVDPDVVVGLPYGSVVVP